MIHIWVRHWCVHQRGLAHLIHQLESLWEERDRFLLLSNLIFQEIDLAVSLLFIWWKFHLETIYLHLHRYHVLRVCMVHASRSVKKGSTFFSGCRDHIQQLHPIFVQRGYLICLCYTFLPVVELSDFDFFHTTKAILIIDSFGACGHSEALAKWVLQILVLFCVQPAKIRLSSMHFTTFISQLGNRSHCSIQVMLTG